MSFRVNEVNVKKKNHTSLEFRFFLVSFLYDFIFPARPAFLKPLDRLCDFLQSIVAFHWDRHVGGCGKRHEKSIVCLVRSL